jgi:hypothetical protein
MSQNSNQDTSMDLQKRLKMGLVDYLKKNDWDVVHVADVEGYREPFEIGGSVPDIIAKRPDGLIAVGLAETCDTLESEETLNQITALSNLFTTNDKREVPLFIVVPHSCIESLENLINSKYPTRTSRITCVGMARV